jgi:6-pyruvoyl-tetrahydropterin synthase
MSNRTRNNYLKRQHHLPEIKDFLNDANLKWEFIHGHEWHIRVEGVIDIFPTRKKYHVLASGARGSFADYDELGRIFLEALK